MSEQRPEPVKETPATAAVASREEIALRMLLEQFEFAESQRSSTWAYAVRRENLRALGLNDSTFQVLLQSGYLKEGKDGNQSLLILTKEGAVHVREDLAERAGKPRWDPLEGTLWFRGKVVLRLRHKAANERCLLNAFQKPGWPRCIRNPFLVEGRKGPKVLYHTCEYLNRKLRKVAAGIRFMANGKGEASWELGG